MANINLILILIYIFIVSFVSANEYDNDTINAGTSNKKNLISIELGGNGIIYSLNYSRFFNLNNNTQISTRGGLGILWDNEGHYEIVIPLECYFKFGRFDKAHFFEIGSGITFHNTFENNNNPEYKNYIIGRLGYCYHKPASRLNIRIGFTPIIDYKYEFDDGLIIPSGGLSIGYSF